MVGVPGKSKGCSTCRRRKKGCDQKRPICGQCQHSGYVCGGYKRELTFLHHPASKIVEKAKFLPHTNKGQAVTTNPFWNYSVIDSQCRSMFWDLYMPRGNCVVKDQMIIRCGHPMNWTQMVQELPGAESALELAFSALSISSVGHDNTDGRLVRESTKLYGKALKDLQSALYDPARMYSDEVLTACMLLGLYEVFVGSARPSFGWSSHTEGAARLVELRGPERYRTRQAHHVFLGARLPILYAGILKRKTTFLSSELWLTVPWTGHPRTFHDRLIDIFTRIPAVLAQVDIANLIDDAAEARTQRLQVVEQCDNILQGVHGWRKMAKEACIPDFLRHETKSGDSYPFETEVWFKNHLYAHSFVLYWTSCLIMHDTLYELHLSLDFETSENASLEPSWQSQIAKARENAVKVAQCIPYCLQPEMGALGPTLIGFPTGLAFKFFQQLHEVQICSWIVECLKALESRGLHIGQFAGFSSKDDYPGHSDERTRTDLSRKERPCRLPGCKLHRKPELQVKLESDLSREASSTLYASSTSSSVKQ